MCKTDRQSSMFCCHLFAMCYVLKHESSLVSYPLIPGERTDKKSPERSYPIMGKLWGLAEAGETQASCSDF